MKLKHISAAVALTVLLPFAANALTTDDLQAQIQSLLAQISQLQEQLKSLQGNHPVACTMEAKICPDGSAVGRSGPNCEFAACPGWGGSVIVPPTNPVCPILNRPLSWGATGSDVSSLQAYLGVSQTGYFGPMTEAAVQQLQSNEGIVSSGTAATTGWGAVGAKTRAALIRRCGGGGWSQNFSASPTLGTAPLTVTFKTNLRIPAEFESGAQDTFYYRTYFGDGQSSEIDSRGLSHTYASTGTYMATLMRIFSCGSPAPGLECGPRPQETVGTVTITVGGTTGSGAPSISGLDAPTLLSVGQTGTWTVHTNTAGGNLSYSVVWGDEAVLDQIRAYAGVAWLVQSSSTFTHAYASAGTYKPAFTVSNDSGSAQTSASVTVRGTAIMCEWLDSRTACPTGQHYESGPVTYDSNGCKLPSQKCVPDTTSSMFSATPTSGTAPLRVVFLAGVQWSSAYSVNFGDGQSSALQNNCPGSWIGACGQPTAEHAYASPGTYTATLMNGNGQCSGGGWTLPCTSGASLGTVTITVGGSTGWLSASATQNTNLANILTALESALEKFLGQ